MKKYCRKRSSYGYHSEKEAIKSWDEGYIGQPQK